MEEQVFNVMLSQGAFGALFVWLLFSTRKESKELLDRHVKKIKSVKISTNK